MSIVEGSGGFECLKMLIERLKMVDECPPTVSSPFPPSLPLHNPVSPHAPSLPPFNNLCQQSQSSATISSQKPSTPLYQHPSAGNTYTGRAALALEASTGRGWVLSGLQGRQYPAGRYMPRCLWRSVKSL